MNCPGEGDGLKELYKAIESSVEEEGMLILIDDISSLVWCGFEPERVADFMMAVKALSTRVSYDCLYIYACRLLIYFCDSCSNLHL